MLFYGKYLMRILNCITFFLRNCSFNFSDKSQKHTEKKFYGKECILCDPIYMKSQDRPNQHMTGNRAVASSERWDWNRKWLGRNMRELCGVMEMFNSYCDRDLGYRGVCMCQIAVNVQLRFVHITLYISFISEGKKLLRNIEL